MTISIRPATAADAQRIKDLIHEVKINPMHLDWERFLVAEEAGTLLGCVQIKPHAEGVRELASVAVVPARQGQGIGTLLVQAMLEREPGPLYLTCRKHNVSYYEHFGFAEIDPKEYPRSFRLPLWIARLFARFTKFEGVAMMKREGSSTDQAVSGSKD